MTDIPQIDFETDARMTPFVAKMGRKVGPQTDALKHALRARAAALQATVNNSDETFIAKVSYLSSEAADMRFRKGMRELRAEQKEAGIKSVMLTLDPTQQALVKALGYSSKLATAVNNIIFAQMATGGYVPPAAEEINPAAPLDGEIAAKHTHKGALIELWMMKDGSLDGKICFGANRQRLSSLSFAALIGLWHLAQSNEDRRNAAYVEAFLDAAVPDWQDRANPEAAAASAVAEHYEILGVSPDATFEEAKSGYRKALMTAHPDHGGKSWMLRAVQQAWNVVKGIEEARLEAEREAAEQAAKAAKMGAMN
jgi:hypothetical protein